MVFILIHYRNEILNNRNNRPIFNLLSTFFLCFFTLKQRQMQIISTTKTTTDTMIMMVFLDELLLFPEINQKSFLNQISKA